MIPELKFLKIEANFVLLTTTIKTKNCFQDIETLVTKLSKKIFRLMTLNGIKFSIFFSFHFLVEVFFFFFPLLLFNNNIHF